MAPIAGGEDGPMLVRNESAEFFRSSRPAQGRGRRANRASTSVEQGP